MPKLHLTWLTALLLALAAVAVPALAGDEKIDVVYHISDEDKVAFALNNMQNHIEGAGADNVNIVLVSHGPAVKRFIDIEAVDRIRSSVAKLQEQGVTFEACANTLQALSVEPDELLPGFAIAEQGGVTRIAELQSKGYAYIRP